jgi:hypothetical protein
MVKKSNDKFYAICDVCSSVNISNADRYKDYISGISQQPPLKNSMNF